MESKIPQSFLEADGFEKNGWNCYFSNLGEHTMPWK